MNPTVLLDGARALRALPPPSLDLAQIPPLQHAAPPTIGIAMPDGSQTELPGALWPEPDLWAASERRARAGAPPAIEIRRLTRAESNVLAADWHPLGAETRPFGYHAFALFLKNEPVALASAGLTRARRHPPQRVRRPRPRPAPAKRDRAAPPLPLPAAKDRRKPAGDAAPVARLPSASLLALLPRHHEGRAGVLLDAGQGRPHLPPRRLGARARLQRIGRRRHLV